MEYGMVSVLIPKEYEETFRTHAKGTMQDAANALQWNLYHGLCENLHRDIPLFNLLPCGSYPQYYCRPFIPRFSFASKGQNLSFCNIKLIRNYFKSRTLYKALDAWCHANSEPKTLFVYTISQPILSAASKIKKQYPQLRVCAIVADLPDMANLSSRQSFLLRFFSAKRAQESYSLLSCVDSFVLLTKHMADYMHITQPFCVMEGIVPEASDLSGDPGVLPISGEEKFVLYTGTLHRKFGVVHLLEAFREISDPDIRLLICGVGDSEAEIREASRQDPRIVFLGQLRRDETLMLQRQASVLVNPRQNNEEFTKYSFPSKTMEYLASGVPVVAYKLDGIPDEYDPYLTYPKDDSVSSLAYAIESLCLWDPQAKRKMGTSAKFFVLRNKNARVQTKRILDFLQALPN